MGREADLLLAELSESPKGMTRPEVLAWLQEQTPWAGPADAESLLTELGSDITAVDGRLRASRQKEGVVTVIEQERPWKRFVVFDLETVVRLVTKAPYKEQRIFQVGATRFGRDDQWIGENREFCMFSELGNEEEEALIYKEDMKARYQRSKKPLADVLEAFSEFCTGADAVVAYNGTGLDFPVIEKEMERCGLPPIFQGAEAPRRVDALYLAQALWPVPPRQHRLGQLLERLQLDVEDMQWHDALDDAKMVVELLEYGAAEVMPSLGESMLALIVSAAFESDAWRLMMALLDEVPQPREHTHQEVAEIVEDTLERKPGKVPLRSASEAEKDGSSSTKLNQEVKIPSQLLDERGRVSLEKLVSAVKGERAEPRESQKTMVTQLRQWLREEMPALVEAPTGTGKSYALLTVALDWLADNPQNKAVISTFTKQLQSQLARDIEALTETVLPELATAADMVKGAANRLSLRALILALKDMTTPGSARGRDQSAGFLSDPYYRDLVVYLLLRFVAEGKPTEEWETRSVDPVDVPPFFQEYCRRRLSIYLSSLSQAENQDYGIDRGGVGLYTMSVREALETRRLIVANHALLLAHLDDFEDLGEHTLLFVDEAHELENAATSALSPEVDSQELGELARHTRDWARDQGRTEEVELLLLAVEKLEMYLEDNRLENAAMRAFDIVEKDPLSAINLRAVTVASPLQGDAFIRPMEMLAAELRMCRRMIGILNQAFREAIKSPPADPFERERLSALYSRAAELDKNLSAIVGDIDIVLAPREGAAPVGNEEAAEVLEKSNEATALESAKEEALELVETTEEGTEEDRLVPVDESEESEMIADEDEDEATPLTGHPVSPRPNRVVFATEMSEPSVNAGHWYRFKVTSSPIELGREEPWARFKRSFKRAYYVSATLRVADNWGFIRRRLDLPEKEARAIALDSPFDVGSQAELICFEDFPSWTEHAEAAMHTVAHQLTGYAEAMIDLEGRNGAMVLTTSRSSAAGIFDWLARIRAAEEQFYPLISAGLEGNQRAVETFKRNGGVMVGTRGLWQGVDIEDSERLRLVWINKLPFAPFADPVIAARIALEVEAAGSRGEEDPEGYANEHYYLPLAALGLRQAVGRLIRTQAHRGVIMISDRKLAGPSRLRRLYRQVFLGSLDRGLMKKDAETGEEWLGNVCTMKEGWARAFQFYARNDLLSQEAAKQWCTEESLLAFTELPETLAILEQEMSSQQVEEFKASGTFADELIRRSGVIAGHLKSAPGPIPLKDKQVEAIRALAEGKDVLGVLPTGYGKSYVFQLPALALPGVTIVVSPLVSLMTDQALELNRTISGRVRALVAPMRESNSRTGKSEVEQELKGFASHGIKIVYLSPERLCQRHFQEWIRAGVERGIVRRVALDEAHTFVQWGDDFRPSFRRAEEFLRRLKSDHQELQIMALTATANETVRDGLRRSVFDLKPQEARPNFAFVTANPLRPELALYRRSLPRHQGGSTSVAGLLERVVDALEGHAILYCLTVKQTEAVHAHLSDYLQGHGMEVMKYHGRLTDAEKTRTANAFRSAPKKDEDGYRRMIVVATSAFGLGIDRPDIRTVFCVSPPTDLAALYQQLGRAGRDRAANPDQPGLYTAGLALIYPRARSVISFMTKKQVARDVLAMIGGKILEQKGFFSSSQLAQELIDARVKAGKMSPEEAAKSETVEQYQTRFLRVLAELSSRGVVRDLGDFPRTLLVRKGEYEAEPGWKPLVDAISTAIPGDGKVETVDLYRKLAPQFGEEIEDAGALWHVLLELHTLGHLDVSQRYNREQLTGLEVLQEVLPHGALKGLMDGQAQTQKEVASLYGWFSSPLCCNQDFKLYFGADDLPDGICADDSCRCSVCWNKAGLGNASEPKLFDAFRSDDLSPSSASGRGRRRSEDQLDNLVQRLLWHNYSGLGANIIWAVIRGEEYYFSRAKQRREPLWPRLLLSGVRGRKPALRRNELEESLGRLMARDEVRKVGARYRLARYVRQDQDRSAEEGGGDAVRTAPGLYQ
jgi:RecQ family ATP-dependent DNA helicase